MIDENISRMWNPSVILKSFFLKKRLFFHYFVYIYIYFMLYLFIIKIWTQLFDNKNTEKK